jgi:hypothetical protein
MRTSRLVLKGIGGTAAVHAESIRNENTDTSLADPSTFAGRHAEINWVALVPHPIDTAREKHVPIEVVQPGQN